MDVLCLHDHISRRTPEASKWWGIFMIPFPSKNCASCTDRFKRVSTQGPKKTKLSVASSKLQETKPSPWCWRAVATTQTKPRSRRPQRLRRRLRRCRPGNGPPFFKGWFFGGYRLQLGYHWERPHVFGFCQISEDWAECLSAVSCESGSGRNHPAQWEPPSPVEFNLSNSIKRRGAMLKDLLRGEHRAS